MYTTLPWFARGNLFFQVARIAEAKRPKVIFLENVKNLVTHDNGNTMKVIVQELEKMAQRLEAAKLLLQGQTYEQVIEKTSISSTTLSRVSRCIRYGNGGYKTIINKENNNQL